MNYVKHWLEKMWKYDVPKQDLSFAYQSINDLVLQDLVDKFVFVAGVPNDPVAIARHMGQQDVVQKILETVDMSRRPEKYKTEVKYTGRAA